MLARKSLLVFVSNLFGAAAGMVGLFVIARYMGPEPLGMWAFALSVAGIGSVIANLGFSEAHIKHVASGTDPADGLATFVAVKVFLAGLFVAVTLGAAWILENTFGFHGATTLSVIAVAVLYTVIQQLQSIAAIAFQAFRHAARSEVMNAIDHLTRLPVIIAVAFAFGASNGRWIPIDPFASDVAGFLAGFGPFSDAGGAALIGAANIVGITASLLSGIYLLRRFDHRLGHLSMDLFRSYRAFALPLAISSSILVLGNKVDTFMVGFFWSSQEVGYYYAAQRAVFVLLVIPRAVRTLFFSLISEVAATGDRTGVAELTRSAARGLNLVVVPMSLMLVAFPEEGIRIFLSNAFLPAAPVLAILALQPLLGSHQAVATSVVKGLGQPRIAMQTTFFVVTANLVLNAVMIPDSLLGIPMLGWKATGAAFATILSAALGTGWIVYKSGTLMGQAPLSWSLLLHLGAGLIATLGLAWGLDVVGWHVQRWYELAGVGVLVVAIYTGLLVAVREVGSKDWLLVKDLLHPGNMARYVRDEMRRGPKP